jgi:membrane peptidoglycan carboxypeptidase
VLRLMEQQGRVSPEAARAARAEPLGVAPSAPPRAQDPINSAYFTEAVRAELERALGDSLYAQPVRVFTTLDLAVQREAVAALEAQLQAIEAASSGPSRGRATRPGPPPTLPTCRAPSS